MTEEFFKTLDRLMQYSIEQEKEIALKNGEEISDEEARRRVNAFHEEKLKELEEE